MARPVQEESYFVSMTDLMVGMLFIFIIVLMAFALNLREQQDRHDRATQAVTETKITRREMLENIKTEMERRGVKVIIDPKNGVLRLPEELLFPRGAFELTDKGRNALTHLANVLAMILPCYATSLSYSADECPPSRGGRLEAVYIEGHTDDRPIIGDLGKGIRSNWELSTARAITTFQALVQEEPELAEIYNDNDQKILGVSGYAENRPARLEDTEDARSANRRIDLRLLMAAPTSDDIDQMQNDVDKSGTAL